MKGCWVRTKETNRKKHTVPVFLEKYSPLWFSNDACSMVNEIISNIALHQQIRIYRLCCVCIAARQVKFYLSAMCNI